MNVLKTGLLFTVLTLLFVALGSMIGGTSGAVIAFAIAVVMNLGTFWFSDKLVIKMTRAQPVERHQSPELFDMVERLSSRANIPMPKLYVVPDPSPNAFATGRNPENAAVAVNQGLLQILDRPEVEGVIAHEIAHIRSRDTLTMAVVATVAGAIMMLASFARFAAIFGGGDEDGPNPIVLIAMAIVAPLAAMIIQFSISRAREYEADKLGAQIAGSPTGLANALLKLERGAEMVPSHMPAQAAHMCIVNPLAGVGGMLKNLLSTHPPIEERVNRLRAMAVR